VSWDREKAIELPSEDYVWRGGKKVEAVERNRGVKGGLAWAEPTADIH